MIDSLSKLLAIIFLPAGIVTLSCATVMMVEEFRYSIKRKKRGRSNDI